MKRFMLSLCALAIGILLATTLFIGQPSKATAGGFPCFQCHGLNFEGSDIAPRVAGTTLTDEQIKNQMRHPRGVMPAFSESDWPDPQTAITYIRAQPTGKPTMAMSPREKSLALAMIAGIAAARATAILQSASSDAASTPTPAQVAAAAATPTSTQVAALAVNTVAPTAAPAVATAPANAPSPLGWMLMLGALLTVGASVLWLRQRA